jgi:D-alanyl-lipoteichoic acid acyltransferase DltB (MBOAT superfamily)
VDAARCELYILWLLAMGVFVRHVCIGPDYVTAQLIDSTPIEQKRKRKLLLMFTIIVNIGLLAYFKYLFFFSTNANMLMSWLGLDFLIPTFKVILPLGISFYTFETISYTVDVYRRLIPAEKNFLNYGLFVTFFPKLVAGPIQRAGELLDQLKQRPRFQLIYLSDGLTRILNGLFLKVVIADNISPLVDEGFLQNPSLLSAIDVWTMAFLFGMQIYFDFSAYSHIALGTAKLMGITVPENFNFPYSSSSFRDFWKRWHISLSSWIRDYIYLPLAGIQVVKTTGAGGIGEGLDKSDYAGQRTTSLFVTWAVMGLWHGANWTYVVWGLYHAIMIFMERTLKPWREKISFFNHPLVGWFLTVPLAMLGWIFFRAESVTQAFTLVSKVVSLGEYKHLNFRENTYLVAAALMIATICTYFVSNLARYSAAKWRWMMLPFHLSKFAFIMAAVFIFLRPIKQYIYFQF